MIRLIATDLDGTLLCPGGKEISPRNAKALEAAVSKGVHVIISTGRLHTGALPYARLLPGDVPVISANGAVVRTSRSGAYLRRCPVEPHLAREILPLLRAAGMSPWFYIGDTCWAERRDEGTAALEARTGARIECVGDLAEKAEDGAEKILGILPHDKTARLQDELSEMYRGKLYVTRSAPNQIEILSPDATKGLALEFAAQKLGIAREEIVAFGDNFNDLELFRGAGIKVAMGNAEEPLKAAADIVTGTNEESGVAQVLEELLSQQD
ncbi:MAG: Cof-type HAD-IIB family hydrolase [Pyramidobacter sp.]|nr:Cof-type HAD-IIB family hydrolase [Pyramidobacter sp.]